MKRHPDACSCGGLWVGGVCCDCRAVCQCGQCSDSWDAICERLVIDCERLPEDTGPNPDPCYVRLRTRLMSAAATYRKARKP